jgi:hypothetical protein
MYGYCRREEIFCLIAAKMFGSRAPGSLLCGTRREHGNGGQHHQKNKKHLFHLITFDSQQS